MIVLTGGTGLVGAHLLYELLCHTSTPIRALYRKEKNTAILERLFLTYNPTAISLMEKIEWFPADILDVPALEQALKGAKEVYHCAGKVSFSPKDKSSLFKTNVGGTANIVNVSLASKVGKLCYVSSIATFSPKREEVVIEQTEQVPSKDASEAYALSKYEAEMEIWRGVQEGLPTVVVYPSVIIGVGVESHPAMNVRKLCHIPYITAGGTGFVAAQDVAKAMRLLMESPIVNEGFILNGENLSYQEFFAQLREEYPLLPEKKLISTTLLRSLSYVDAFFSLFGRPRQLSSKMRQTLQTMTYYDGSKVLKPIDFAYTPIKKSLEKLSL